MGVQLTPLKNTEQPQFAEDIVAKVQAELSGAGFTKLLHVQRPNYGIKVGDANNLYRTSLSVEPEAIVAESGTPVITTDTVVRSTGRAHIINILYGDRADTVVVVFETEVDKPVSKTRTRHYIPRERLDFMLQESSKVTHRPVESVVDDIYAFLTDGSMPQ
jgi:hypothetical protein